MLSTALMIGVLTRGAPALRVWTKAKATSREARQSIPGSGNKDSTPRELATRAGFFMRSWGIHGRRTRADRHKLSGRPIRALDGISSGLQDRSERRYTHHVGHEFPTLVVFFGLSSPGNRARWLSPLSPNCRGDPRARPGAVDPQSAVCSENRRCVNVFFLLANVARPGASTCRRSRP